MKTKLLVIFILGMFLSSCYTTQCVSVTDKHIKGQKNKYAYNHKKCPKGGSYYRWLFFIKR